MIGTELPKKGMSLMFFPSIIRKGNESHKESHPRIDEAIVFHAPMDSAQWRLSTQDLLIKSIPSIFRKGSAEIDIHRAFTYSFQCCAKAGVPNRDSSFPTEIRHRAKCVRTRTRAL